MPGPFRHHERRQPCAEPQKSRIGKVVRPFPGRLGGYRGAGFSSGWCAGGVMAPTAWQLACGWCHDDQRDTGRLHAVAWASGRRPPWPARSASGRRGRLGRTGGQPALRIHRAVPAAAGLPHAAWTGRARAWPWVTRPVQDAPAGTRKHEDRHHAEPRSRQEVAKRHAPGPFGVMNGLYRMGGARWRRPLRHVRPPRP
jgi:hypothetical protein